MLCYRWYNLVRRRSTPKNFRKYIRHNLLTIYSSKILKKSISMHRFYIWKLFVYNKNPYFIVLVYSNESQLNIKEQLDLVSFH